MDKLRDAIGVGIHDGDDGMLLDTFLKSYLEQLTKECEGSIF